MDRNSKKFTTLSLSELQSTLNDNVFVMMRYRSDDHFRMIEESIRETLTAFGLNARFAKDSAIVDDLWDNIVYYIDHCRYGIAVFEDIDERYFNPNISLELGYMYAQGKRCLLLKERRMPRLPTDICGRIYRDFDALNLKVSIQEQISEWCKNDLRINRVGEGDLSQPNMSITFDSRTEDPEFRTWGVFASDGRFTEHISLDQISDVNHTPSSSNSFLRLVARGTESVGVNRNFQLLQGRARFQYRAVISMAENRNLLFCMIPMQGELNDLIEVGASQREELENAYSPYRVRYFVPEVQIGNQDWQWAEIDFDFHEIPSASYSIFAPRINEGCPRPGPGELHIRSLEILIPKR